MREGVQEYEGLARSGTNLIMIFRNGKNNFGKWGISMCSVAIRSNIQKWSQSGQLEWKQPNPPCPSLINLSISFASFACALCRIQTFIITHRLLTHLYIYILYTYTSLVCVIYLFYLNKKLTRYIYIYILINNCGKIYVLI